MSISAPLLIKSAFSVSYDCAPNRPAFNPKDAYPPVPIVARAFHPILVKSFVKPNVSSPAVPRSSGLKIVRFCARKAAAFLSPRINASGAVATSTVPIATPDVAPKTTSRTFPR